MAPNERLVEYNNTSIRWDAADAHNIGGTLVAQSWVFTNQSWYPTSSATLTGMLLMSQVYLKISLWRPLATSLKSSMPRYLLVD